MKLELKCDFHKLVTAFEGAPNKVRSLVRLQLQKAGRDIIDYAREHHNYKTRTGKLEREGLVMDMPDDFTAVISTNKSVPYAVMVHEGTEPHVIEPRNKLALRWAKGGEFVFAKRVFHPGTKPDQFLYNAAEEMWPRIQGDFENALDNLL